MAEKAVKNFPSDIGDAVLAIMCEQSQDLEELGTFEMDWKYKERILRMEKTIK